MCDSDLADSHSVCLGCAVMGVGIALEVRCGSVAMPGEGFPVALSRVTGVAFPRVKIVVDTVLVVLAVVSSYLFLVAGLEYCSRAHCLQ